jgi:phosphoglycolate phosphatase-like HAD superfamily hydrolase
MLINFDFDGVIADSFDDLFRLLHHSWEAVGAGREPVPEDLRTCNDLTFEGLAYKLGMPAHLNKPFRMAAHQLMASSSEKLPGVFDGMPRIMQQLAKKHVLTVVTANVESTVRGCLEKAGLNDTVTMVLDGSQPGTKSDKLTRACRHFSIAAEKAVMVGDAVSDIREGKKAGVWTIAVAWGYQSVDRLQRYFPDGVARTPTHLFELIHNLAA